GQVPSFVAGRDPQSLDVTFVCRYAKEEVQELLTDEERAAFEKNRQQRIEESLSILYVAMTRARNALYLFVPEQRRASANDSWYKVVGRSLAPEGDCEEHTLLFEHGDTRWFDRLPPATSSAEFHEPVRRECITFRSAKSQRRRGLEHAAPSKQEGHSHVNLKSL